MRTILLFATCAVLAGCNSKLTPINVSNWVPANDAAKRCFFGCRSRQNACLSRCGGRLIAGYQTAAIVSAQQGCSGACVASGADCYRSCKDLRETKVPAWKCDWPDPDRCAKPKDKRSVWCTDYDSGELFRCR